MIWHGRQQIGGQIEQKRGYRPAPHQGFAGALIAKRFQDAFLQQGLRVAQQRPILGNAPKVLSQRCLVQAKALEDQSWQQGIGDAHNAFSAIDLRQIQPVQPCVKAKRGNQLGCRNFKKLRRARGVQQPSQNGLGCRQGQQLHRRIAKNFSNQDLEFAGFKAW